LKFSIDKILVPIDGSESSEEALRYACNLASRLEASVTVLYVVNTPYIGDSPSMFSEVDSLLAEGRRVLEAARKTGLVEGYAGMHFELRQGIGNPGHEIKFCEEGSFSLVVMSARGRTPFTHLLIGSVSSTVVQHAICPVLVVRKSSDGRQEIGSNAA
jgi:nucleotide-binding universal stress UspA family protein